MWATLTVANTPLPLRTNAASVAGGRPNGRRVCVTVALHFRGCGGGVPRSAPRPLALIIQSFPALTANRDGCRDARAHNSPCNALLLKCRKARKSPACNADTFEDVPWLYFNRGTRLSPGCSLHASLSSAPSFAKAVAVSGPAPSSAIADSFFHSGSMLSLS